MASGYVMFVVEQQDLLNLSNMQDESTYTQSGNPIQRNLFVVPSAKW